MLKKPLDPIQGPARPNSKHIANRLRNVAKKIVDHRRLDQQGKTCGYRLNTLILVSYDRFLWQFLDGVRTHPQETFTYPSDIEAKLKVVLEGLTNIYTDPSLILPPTTARIDWTPSPPVFLITSSHQPRFHVCPVKRLTPYDPRELKWLEAFLKVVTWMEENFGPTVDTDAAALKLDDMRLDHRVSRTTSRLVPSLSGHSETGN